MEACIVGSSGKLGLYMVRHALLRGWEVVGMCRARNVTKLAEFQARKIGALFVVEAVTNDPLIGKAPAIVGCQTGSARLASARPSPGA